MRTRNQGFTLIELMIVVAIIAIVAAIAYPNYINHVKTTRRAEIVALLTQGAQALERQYSQSGSYATLTTADPVGNATYTVIAVRTATTFTLTATPVASGIMANDTCGNFVLTNTGARSNTGSTAVATCWGR
ncbi:type IV pilin protein [Pseudomonas sp. dw_358]|uniref:type IV pilin protein n=1 Tax=Pseudomonas sp. dw_358 TaxID=2720083 RepID=UPI001BD3479E|nr:type IV pilin protein [Pseudomonas sp. dw_358]